MITNEQHEEFLTQIDDYIKCVITEDSFGKTTSNTEYCLGIFTKLKYGKELPIVWVKPNNIHGITEFYSSEMNLPWLVTYVHYYNNFISNKGEEDEYDIYKLCLYMSLVMTMVKGINVVDNVVYLLANDTDFVNYSMKRELFI